MDASYGPSQTYALGQIYAWVGEYDKAIDQIELLFSIPFNASIHDFVFDPGWAPIQNHPRFKRLLAEYGVE